MYLILNLSYDYLDTLECPFFLPLICITIYNFSLAARGSEETERRTTARGEINWNISIWGISANSDPPKRTIFKWMSNSIRLKLWKKRWRVIKFSSYSLMSIGLKCDTLNVESLIIFVAISSMKMDVFSLPLRHTFWITILGKLIEKLKFQCCVHVFSLMIVVEKKTKPL